MYGSNDYSLMDGLDQLGITGVLGVVHEDQCVCLEEPVIAIHNVRKEGEARNLTGYNNC